MPDDNSNDTSGNSQSNSNDSTTNDSQGTNGGAGVTTDWREGLGDLRSNEGISKFQSARELAQAYLDKPDAPKLPENKDGYTVPERVKIKGLRQMAHENRMTQAQLDGILKYNEKMTKAALEQRKTRLDSDMAKLKEEWGDNYDANVKQAEKVLSKMDFDDGTVAKLLTTAGLDKDTKLLKFLYKVSKSMGEDTFVNSEGNVKMPSSSLASRLFPNHPK